MRPWNAGRGTPNGVRGTKRGGHWDRCAGAARHRYTSDGSPLRENRSFCSAAYWPLISGSGYSRIWTLYEPSFCASYRTFTKSATLKIHDPVNCLHAVGTGHTTVVVELGEFLLASQDPLDRLNSVLKTRLPSAFRRCSPMGPPAASYVPGVSSRNGEHSRRRPAVAGDVRTAIRTIRCPPREATRLRQNRRHELPVPARPSRTPDPHITDHSSRSSRKGDGAAASAARSSSGANAYFHNALVTGTLGRDDSAASTGLNADVSPRSADQ
jgi:hypothetical protein